MGGILQRLSGFIEILRVHNLVASAIAALLGFMTVYRVPDSGLSMYSSIPPLITVVLVAGGGYVINDFFDVEVDSVNKPLRPIPSGRVLKDEALALSLVLMATGIVAALLTTGMISFTYALLNAILLVLYSKSLKRRGLLGNMAVSIASANSIVYGGLAASEVTGRLDLVSNTMIPALYALLFTVMREIVKGIEDYVGDSRSGIKTLAVVGGIGYAARVSKLLIAAVIAVSPLPYVLGTYGVVYLTLVAVADAVLIKSLMLLRRGSEEEVIRRAAVARGHTKVAMVLGISAFLLDLVVR